MTSVDRPRLSVVIPTYNGRPLLETCLASLARHRPAEGVEILVADDASKDDTVAWLIEEHPDVRLVSLPTNGGFVAAANAGIAAARGEFVQLLNNDAEVTAGWFEAGLAPFADPTVGSVAPLVLVRADPERVDSAGDQYAIVGWPSKRGHGELASRWRDRATDQVFGASGSSAIYRSEALRRVGAYDPAFGSYYEDIDLAFRLRWAGYSCVFTPSCRILHDISATYDHAKPELQRRMSRNAELLFWTDLPRGWLIVATVPHLAFTAAQLAWKSVRGRGFAFLLGKIDALRMLPSFRKRRIERTRLALSPIARPHFPMNAPTFEDVRNHWKRPRETTRRS